jgi:hypothetical protein
MSTSPHNFLTAKDFHFMEENPYVVQKNLYDLNCRRHVVYLGASYFHIWQILLHSEVESQVAAEPDSALSKNLKLEKLNLKGGDLVRIK